MPELTVRPLAAEDLPAAARLSELAFGHPASAQAVRDDINRWGAFDASGRLVAKVTDLRQEQWWGGRILPTSGIAGVAVAPEARGTGVFREVMTAALRAAQESGAALATLFCTTSAPYRALGFELTGAMREVLLPTASLRRLPRSLEIEVRAATGADYPQIRAVYDEVCRVGEGLLSRRGSQFPDPRLDELPEGLDGITLACGRDGQPLGYASYERGRGYADSSVLTVPDLLAVTPAAAIALRSVLASWSAVTPTLKLRPLPWLDAVNSVLPLERMREANVMAFMHRPLDIAAAVAARGWPAVSGTAEFRLVDPIVEANDGAWRLNIEDGTARLERTHAEPGATLTTQAWAALWCGAARAGQLRQAGLLSGSDADCAALDRTLGSGQPVALLDYF